MGLRVGVLFLIIFGTTLSNASQLMNSTSDRYDIQMSHLDQEREVTSKEVSRNENLCTLCEEFATQALEYFSQNKTQTEIIETLHVTCSELHSLKQQCITLVDYYAPLFFLEITSIEPANFCRNVDLCQRVAIISSQFHENSCDLCHQTVSEILVKLKDPDTQLDIIELLLKACNSIENHVKQCKRLVFMYGPPIIANAEKILETKDICKALHACSTSTVTNEGSSYMEKEPLLSDS